MTDPLDRVLNALDLLHSEGMDPVVLDAWQEARDALHEARERHAALLAVAHRARELIDLLDRYQEALEDGDEDLIALVAGAGSEAEDRLVDALNNVVPDLQDEPELSGEAAHLAALDGFADEEDGTLLRAGN
jgi:hypothetical protein